MKSMFDLITGMPLYVIAGLALLMRGKQKHELTLIEIHNRLRAITLLVELMPRPESSFETTMSNRVLEWCGGEIDELSARATLIQANVLFVGTVPVIHSESVKRSN